jgi:hypothetical protein
MRAFASQTVLATIVLAALAGRTAFAQTPPETLDAAMTKLAANVKNYLDEKKESTVVVGKFQGPPGLPNSSGLAIQRALVARLAAIGCKTDGVGRGIRGSYKVSANGKDPAVVLIMASMITRMGDEDLTFVAKFQDQADANAVIQKVTSEEDVNKVLGTTADLSTGNIPATNKPADRQAALQERTERIAESIQNPTVSIQPSKAQAVAPSPTSPNAPPVTVAGGAAVNSVVSATAASPYRMEILVRNPMTKQFEPRKVEDKGGLAFASLLLADEYAIRLINDADHDVGVKLLVDSLSMFEFTKIEPYRKLQMVWIGAKSSGVITGWHITNDQSAAFQITDLPKSAAFQKGVQEGDIGQVTAMFFPSWVGNTPPAVEVRGVGRAANNLIGTGVGQAIQQKYGEQVANFGVTLLATVTVRYQVPDDLPPPE